MLAMLHPSVTLDSQMLRIPERGVETIMQRQKDRIRSISIGSDRSIASTMTASTDTQGQARLNPSKKLDRSASAKAFLLSGAQFNNRCAKD